MNFMKLEKAAIRKSVFMEYLEDIKFLLEQGYSRTQVYKYLEREYRIEVSIKAFYKFLERHNLKPETNIDKIITQPEPVKEEPKSQEQKTHQKPATKEPKQKVKTTPAADRKKEYKRYLEHWDKQPENYLQYIEDKLNWKEFNTVMNKLIEEKLVASFEDIENFFKEPYKPQYICDYISTCRDKLRNKKNFKAFTPAMFQHFMDDNFFAKPKPEQL